MDDRGELILEEFERLLGSRTKIAAFTHVSNALGTVNPVKDMAEMAHRHGARVLVDGAQSVPHLRANVQEIDADFYVFSGHKLFGPSGVGALYGKKDLLEAMPPWQGGGSMIRHVTFEHTTYERPPARFEAGTPTIADAVGLGAAIDYLERLGIENVARYEHALLAYAQRRLAEVEGLVHYGTAREKVSVLSFLVPGSTPQEVGRYLDAEGIAVRAGHHCAEPTMQHFGIPGTVRPSLAFYNTRGEVDALVDALQRYPRS
jgi:cysteine desulfurase/selenocysteine lyase